MPILNSSIRDARPAINAKAESEKKLFTADVSKGTVNIKRGTGRVVSFAFKYEELRELQNLVAEIGGLLDDNQYSTRDSLEDGYEAGSVRYQAPSRSAGEGAVTAADPTTANETAQVEATTPAAVAAEPAADDSNPFGE